MPKVRTDAVAIIVVNDKQQVLMGRRTDGQGWGLAGGKVEGKETFADAAKRELLEEFNLTALKLKLLGLGDLHSTTKNGVQSWWRPMVYECYDFIGDIKPQPTEVEEYRWFSQSDLRQLYWEGEMFPGSVAVFDAFYRELIYP
jgi:8-oxo-dGTP pyrophosphatase MutT (NUDIX family)